MKIIKFYLLLILNLLFFISCETEYSITKDIDSINIPPKEDPYKPEINLPKEIKISGKYTLTKENKKIELKFEFANKNSDKYCYTKGTSVTSEKTVPLRFRLYNKEGQIVSIGFPVGGVRTVNEFKDNAIHFPNIKEEVIIFSSLPYHKEGVKMKAILVNEQGRDLRVLDERGILPPEEFRERLFHKGCYREIGFHFHR